MRDAEEPGPGEGALRWMASLLVAVYLAIAAAAPVLGPRFGPDFGLAPGNVVLVAMAVSAVALGLAFAFVGVARGRGALGALRTPDGRLSAGHTQFVLWATVLAPTLAVALGGGALGPSVASAAAALLALSLISQVMAPAAVSSIEPDALSAPRVGGEALHIAFLALNLIVAVMFVAAVVSRLTPDAAPVFEATLSPTGPAVVALLIAHVGYVAAAFSSGRSQLRGAEEAAAAALAREIALLDEIEGRARRAALEIEEIDGASVRAASVDAALRTVRAEGEAAVAALSSGGLVGDARRAAARMTGFRRGLLLGLDLGDAALAASPDVGAGDAARPLQDAASEELIRAVRARVDALTPQSESDDAEEDGPQWSASDEVRLATALRRADADFDPADMPEGLRDRLEDAEELLDAALAAAARAA